MVRRYGDLYLIDLCMCSICVLTVYRALLVHYCTVANSRKRPNRALYIYSIFLFFLASFVLLFLFMVQKNKQKHQTEKASKAQIIISTLLHTISHLIVENSFRGIFKQ